MDFSAFVDSNLFAYLVLPLLIFLARIVDVSIGTIRLIYISRGHKILAPFLGFFEVIIWLMAIKQIMGNLSNFVSYIAYGGGFAAGTYIGMRIEERLSVGKVLIRIITGKDASKLLDNLKSERFSATSIGADGPEGKVQLILSVVKRHDIAKVIRIVNEYNPHAFYTIEDVRFAPDAPDSYHPKKFKNFFGFLRKGK